MKAEGERLKVWVQKRNCARIDVRENRRAMHNKNYDLKVRTKAFALRVIEMYSALPENDPVAQVLGKQVLRSATSVGANYREASRGRSKAEFISKVGDSLKEIEETEYWLELLVDSRCVAVTEMRQILRETRELIAIFASIDKKAKEGRG
jgi:four helix bundle protein